MTSDNTSHLDREVKSATLSSVTESNRWRAPKKEGTQPDDGFPLSYHPPSGRIYTVTRQRRHSFGYAAADWQADLVRANV
jgi:hypothetical protein